MNDVYIKKDTLNEWIARNLPNKDLISIEDLLATIEDMDSTIEDLQDKLNEKVNDYPEEERDREKEVLGVWKN